MTVIESADKIAKDIVEHNSSQLSPASEQEQAVVCNNNIEDYDTEVQMNLDAVKRSSTPVSLSGNVSKSNEDAQENIKPAITCDGKAEMAEKRLSLGKPVTIISASAAKAAKAASSMSSIKAATKYKLINAADKRDAKSPKLKSLSNVSQPKLIPSETKLQTPIKSYLSISSILNDFDKSEVPKKPVTKTGSKPFDDDSTTQSNLEKPVVKSHATKCIESIPKSFIEMVTVNVQRNKNHTTIPEPTHPKTINSTQSVVKTETTPCSGRKMPVSIAVTNDGRKTPLLVTSTSTPSGQKTLVTAALTSISGRKTPTPVSVTSTMAPDKKTLLLTTSSSQSHDVEILVPVKSPGSRTLEVTKNASLKSLGLTQSQDVKIPVSTQNSGKKSPIPCQRSDIPVESPTTKIASTSVSVPIAQVKTSASISTPSVISDIKTLLTSVTSSSIDVKTTTTANISNSNTNQSPILVSSQNPDIKPRSNSTTTSCFGVTLTSTCIASTSSSLKPTSTSITSSSSGVTPVSTLANSLHSSLKPTSSAVTALSFNSTLISTLANIPTSTVKPTPATVTLPNFVTKLDCVSTSAASPSAKTPMLTSSSQILNKRPSTPTSSFLLSLSKKMSPMTSTPVSNIYKNTQSTTTVSSSTLNTQIKNSIKSTTAGLMASKTPTAEPILSKVSTVPTITSQLNTMCSVRTQSLIAANGSSQKRASTAVTTSVKPTPIFSLAPPPPPPTPTTKTKSPPTLLPSTSKAPVLFSKANSTTSMSVTSSITKSTSSSMGVVTSLAKPLSIPSSTSITVSSKSLPPPLITLTSTSTTPTLITSKELTASQYIPANTKIPSSLEISFTNNAASTNGTLKSGHFIGKKPSTDETTKMAVKRSLNNDIKSLGEPNKKVSRQTKDSITTSTTGTPVKKIFTPNILPEVSITLNPHPEQNKRISPETSYDVSCFKPSNEAANSVPPLAPLTTPICKNIQNSPIKNLNNKKLSSGVRIVRNLPSMNMKLKHNLPSREIRNGEPEAKKPYLENGFQQQNGFFETQNGKDKFSSPVENHYTAIKSNNSNKTPSPTSGKKEARHQGIPKLIDIKAAPYTKLMAQDAKARLQFLKNALYVNPSTEPTPNAENALDLSSPLSKSPSSDKSDPSPEKKKLIPSVPPHMIPVTMAKCDTKSTTKTSPTLTKIERKPSPIAKLDKSPARKADFRQDNGPPSTPISRSPHSPIFSKTPSPIRSLHLSPPLNQALALNFLHQQQQQYNRELVWLMDAYQNGQLPSHPLMHKNLKPPTPTSEASFHVKK